MGREHKHYCHVICGLQTFCYAEHKLRGKPQTALVTVNIGHLFIQLVNDFARYLDRMYIVQHSINTGMSPYIYLNMLIQFPNSLNTYLMFKQKLYQINKLNSVFIFFVIISNESVSSIMHNNLNLSNRKIRKPNAFPDF